MWLQAAMDKITTKRVVGSSAGASAMSYAFFFGGGSFTQHTPSCGIKCLTPGKIIISGDRMKPVMNFFYQPP